MSGGGFALADARSYFRDSTAATAAGVLAVLYVLLSIAAMAGVGGTVPAWRETVLVFTVYALLIVAVGMLWRYSRNDAVIIVGVMAAIYVVYLMAGVLFLGLPLNGIVNTLRRITFLSAVYAMLVLALNLHWGYTGLFNIGVAGFMAVGVYTMAMLSGPADIALGLPLPVGIVGGVVAAALVGAIAALPALRLDADYLAIVTVALSEIIRLSYNSTVFQSSIPRLRLAGITLLPSIPVGTGGGQGIRTPTNPVRALYYKDPGDTSAGLTDLGEFAFGAADGGATALAALVALAGAFFVAGAVAIPRTD